MLIHNIDFVIDKLEDGNAICYAESEQKTVIINETALFVYEVCDSCEKDVVEQKYITHFSELTNNSTNDFIEMLKNDFNGIVESMLNAGLLIETE